MTGNKNDSPSVMRSTMNGESIEIWATTFGAISALSIDYDAHRLFWIDTSDNNVYAVDINYAPNSKPNPKVFYSDRHSTFSNLANVKVIFFNYWLSSILLSSHRMWDE